MTNWAIVIGINQYTHLPSQQHLRFAVKDAEAVKDFLRDQANFPEENILLCTDATPRRGNLRTRPYRTVLREILLSRIPQTTRIENFWFFFAGHGFSRNDQDYLLPRDGNPNDEETAIPIRFVVDCLRGSQAQNIVLVLDMCRGVISSHGSRGLGEETREITRQQGIITIFSCEVRQRSYEIPQLEHGVFTYALLNGLQHHTSLKQLGLFLRREVPALNQQYETPRQDPWVILEPAWKNDLPLLPECATQADINSFINLARMAQLDERWDEAENLWLVILEMPSVTPEIRTEAGNRLRQIRKKIRQNHFWREISQNHYMRRLVGFVRNPANHIRFYSEMRRAILSLIIILIIWSIVTIFLKPPMPIENSIPISSGERNLTEDKDCENQNLSKEQRKLFLSYKEAGIGFIKKAQDYQSSKSFNDAENSYSQAAKNLGDALKICGNGDATIGNASETRIYYNNARIGTKPSYTLVVAAPIRNEDSNRFANIRGVAQLQHEVNNHGGINFRNPVRILLADDSRISAATEQKERMAEAKKFVAELTLKDGILGVIGHQTSDVMVAVKEEYQNNKLPVVSPSATTSELNNSVEGNYVFRTTPSVKEFAEKLYTRLEQKKITKAAILYTSKNNSEYSIAFEKAVRNRFGDEIVKSFDLDDKSPNEITDSLKDEEVEALIIAVSLTDGKKLNDLSSVTNILKRKIRLFGGNALYSQPFLSRLIDSQDVFIELVSPWVDIKELSPGIPALKPDVRSRNPRFWDGANWFTVMSYDAASAFIAAISKNNLPLQDIEDIKKARIIVRDNLSNVNVSGAFMDFRLLTNGERQNYFQAENKYKPVEAYLSKVIYCPPENRSGDDYKDDKKHINYCYKSVD